MGKISQMGAWTGLAWFCTSVALSQPAGAPGKKQDEAHEQHANKKEEAITKAKAAIAARKEAREETKATPGAPAMRVAVAEKGEKHAESDAKGDDDKDNETEESAEQEHGKAHGPHGHGHPGLVAFAERFGASVNLENARKRAEERLSMIKEGHLDELKQDIEKHWEELRAERKAHWEALKETLKDAKEDLTEVQQELRHHARRVAQLARIAALGNANNKKKVEERVAKLVELENSRHEKKMQALAQGGDSAAPGETQAAEPATAAEPTKPATPAEPAKPATPASPAQAE